MFLHQSSGKVIPGEMVTTFPLRLPGQVGARASEGQKFRATVASFRATSDEVREFTYSAKMWLSFSGGDECYQSFLQSPFAQDKTHATVGDRLLAFSKKAKESYPYLKHLPAVSYGVTSDTQGNFTVTLPPFTSIYSDARGFWDTLGFTGLFRTFDGAKMKGQVAATGVVAGFTNREAATMVVTGRSIFTATEPINVLYRAFAGGAATERPRLEFRIFQDVLPVALAKQMPLTKTAASDGMATLLDDGLRLLGVDETAVFLELVGKNMVFRSREFPRGAAAGTVTVHLEVSGELRSFLKMDEDRLSFPLDDPRTYQAEPREGEEYDALDGHYPVTMVLQQGESVNYVEGRGYCSLLCLMRDTDDVVGGGAVVAGDCEQLTVRFLDKKLKPVLVREHLTCYLALELQSLF
jgi:hypothetical protein